MSVVVQINKKKNICINNKQSNKQKSNENKTKTKTKKTKKNKNKTKQKQNKTKTTSKPRGKDCELKPGKIDTMGHVWKERNEDVRCNGFVPVFE